MELLAASYLLLFFIIAFGLIAVARIFEKTLETERKSWTRLLVIIPRGIDHPLADHRPHEIKNSTELYRRLHELRIPFTLETAVHIVGEEIHFYISVPRMHSRKTAQLIQSLWHTSYVTPADDYELWLDLPAENNEQVATGYLAQARPYCVPLQVAKQGHFEPFLGILRHLANLAAVGEAGALQWIVRPADPGLMQDIASHLEKFRGGEYHPSRHVHEKYLLTPESLKLLEEKARSPLFAVNARIVTAATGGSAREILKRFGNHFEASSITDDQHNHFKLMLPKNSDKALVTYFSRSFDPTQTMILTADELATYFHFPGGRTASPKIKR